MHAPHTNWQLAEVNIARLKAPAGDPLVAPFIDALERVNTIAERIDGFIWRYTDDSGNATDTQVATDPLVIFNASTWRDAQALETFVWGTIHKQFYHRRAEWFEALGSMHFAMWWVPPGTYVTPADAMARLAHLDAHGPSDTAFGWADVPGATRWHAKRCAPLTAAE
ncbi:DUF3291 domain-containing protein [Rhodobacteraceae bacterium N5(2021)]|uniref:DUF3291 domain-containing protein n=1 Tax=Gymnodinialimonas phycosphaerae TaxID=2841589 RepID=A0A975TYK4_9RHOB|nr:DUF3291 domain-containing protein [Gymnodinialimonas phycosphaerae]